MDRTSHGLDHQCFYVGFNMTCTIMQAKGVSLIIMFHIQANKDPKMQILNVKTPQKFKNSEKVRRKTYSSKIYTILWII